MNDSVLWKSGWYASRLHAVPADTVFPEGAMGTVKALCGQFVYVRPPTEWAQLSVDKGVPHCKRCERLLAKEDFNDDSNEGSC